MSSFFIARRVGRGESARPLAIDGRLESRELSSTMTLAVLTTQVLGMNRLRTMKSKTRAGRYARLTEPLVRDGGKLRPATWDEALERAAQGLKSTVERYGPSSFGMFSCSKSTNEMNFVAQKFMRTAIGSNNIDSCNRT